MHHKTAVLAAALFSGFIISSYMSGVLSFLVSAACAVCAIMGSVLLKQRYKTAVLALAGAAAAFLIYGAYSSLRISPVRALYGKTCEMTASVVSVTAPDNDTTYITAEGTADGVLVRFSFSCPDIGAGPGDVLKLEVKFSEPVKTASYSGDYDYSRGIFVRAAQKYAEITGKEQLPSPAALIGRYSEYLRDIVKEELTGDEGALMLAMCFGDKSRMDPMRSDAVARSGLSHMTAVSGMHISLIVTAMMTLTGMSGSGRRRRIKAAAAVLLCVTFMMFFRMTASVCRSGIMLMIYYGAAAFGRRSSPLDSLGAAVILILLNEPCACRDTGLMLSVCGTLGAGALAPRVTEYLRGRFRLPKLTETVTVCVCASLCTLPASAVAFGKISLVSVPASIAVYPFFFAAVTAALAAAFTGGLLGHALFLPAGAMLRVMIAIIRFFASGRFSCIAIDSDIILPFIAATAVFGAATLFIALHIRHKLRLAAAAAVICLCALAGTVTARKVSDSDLTKVNVYSDGRNYLVSVENSAGISAFSSEVNRKLSNAAVEALSDRGAHSFDLLCVLAEKKHSSVYSRTFDSIAATEKRYLENTEKKYDISGRYTATVYEDAVRLDINGVTVLLCDAASAPVYGSHDIAVYSGYKKSVNTDINGITIYCDKRFSDAANNAYFTCVRLLISPSGQCAVRTE